MLSLPLTYPRRTPSGQTRKITGRGGAKHSQMRQQQVVMKQRGVHLKSMQDQFPCRVRVRPYHCSSPPVPAVQYIPLPDNLGMRCCQHALPLRARTTAVLAHVMASTRHGVHDHAIKLKNTQSTSSFDLQAWPYVRASRQDGCPCTVVASITRSGQCRISPKRKKPGGETWSYQLNHACPGAI